jgi:hypothetical protein
VFLPGYLFPEFLTVNLDFIVIDLLKQSSDRHEIRAGFPSLPGAGMGVIVYSLLLSEKYVQYSRQESDASGIPAGFHG